MSPPSLEVRGVSRSASAGARGAKVFLVLAGLSLLLALGLPPLVRSADPELAVWAEYFGGGRVEDPWGNRWNLYHYRLADRAAFAEAAAAGHDAQVAELCVFTGRLPAAGVPGGHDPKELVSHWYSTGPNGKDEQGRGDDLFPAVRAPGSPQPSLYQALPWAPFLAKARLGFVVAAILLALCAYGWRRAHAARSGRRVEVGRVLLLAALPLLWVSLLFLWLVTTPSMTTEWWLYHAAQQRGMGTLVVPWPLGVLGGLIFVSLLGAVWLRSRAPSAPNDERPLRSSTGQGH